MSSSNIDTQNVKRILVCRINHRLGNNLLLTAFLTNLARCFPGAEIDLLLSRPMYGELLQPLASIKQTFVLSHELYYSPLQMLKLRSRLKQRAYDLVIDPTCVSGTGRVAMLLAPAKHKLGFTDGKNRFELTHAVSPRDEVGHDSWQPMQLLEFLRPELNGEFQRELDLQLTPSEREQGRELFTSMLSEHAADIHVGIFCDAAEGKKLPTNWWCELVAEIQKHDSKINVVEIISVNQTEVSVPGIAIIGHKNIRTLASVISHLHLYISADSGPMHLATAAHVPTIGLFNLTDPRQYGPQGKQDFVIDVTHATPQEVRQKILQHLGEIKPASQFEMLSA